MFQNSGIGVPLGLGVMMAPDIIRAVNGDVKPAVAPVDPAKPGTVTINGREYELGLEP